MTSYHLLIRVSVLTLAATLLLFSHDVDAEVTALIDTTNDTLSNDTTFEPPAVVELPLKNASSNTTNEQIYLVSNVILEVGVMEDDAKKGHQGNITEEMKDIGDLFNSTTNSTPTGKQ